MWWRILSSSAERLFWEIAVIYSRLDIWECLFEFPREKHYSSTFIGGLAGGIWSVCGPPVYSYHISASELKVLFQFNDTNFQFSKCEVRNSSRTKLPTLTSASTLITTSIISIITGIRKIISRCWCATRPSSTKRCILTTCIGPFEKVARWLLRTFIKFTSFVRSIFLYS